MAEAATSIESDRAPPHAAAKTDVATAAAGSAAPAVATTAEKAIPTEASAEGVSAAPDDTTAAAEPTGGAEAGEETPVTAPPPPSPPPPPPPPPQPPPPLEELLNTALPKGVSGSLQQQADASMMLLRANWKEPYAAASAQRRVHEALHTIALVASTADALGVLKGTLFQALMAVHQQALQKQREAEERRLALLEAEAGADPSVVAEEATRATLRSSEGERPALPPCLQTLQPYEVERLGAGGAELRALLRIKVEDDADLQTARQALAECGFFLLLLRAEAPKRSLTEAELLKKCDLGEA